MHSSEKLAFPNSFQSQKSSRCMKGSVLEHAPKQLGFCVANTKWDMKVNTHSSEYNFARLLQSRPGSHG